LWNRTLNLHVGLHHMPSPVRFAVLTTVVVASSAFAQAADRQFAIQSCHFSFRHPADWDVMSDTTDSAAPCRFVVRPRNWRQRVASNDSIDLFSVHMQVLPRGVWQEATANAFERRTSGWVILGRMGAAASADSITGTGWTGLRGIAPAGCYREGGGYAGTCDNPTAILGTSTRTVSLVGGPQSDLVVDRIVATLRFDP
jgi:hypothetical protein